MRRLKHALLICALLALGAPAFAATEPSAGTHDAPGEGHGAHGHAPSFDEINWYYGMVGEKEGAEPSLLWRPTGMPAPFGALLLNTALLYFILYKVLRKPITEGLASRKAGILKGMEESAKMKREAEEQLAHYEAKLAGVDKEVQRIQQEMRAGGEAERAHILSEARERRARMERDAHVLIEQELKAMRETLVRETVQGAVRSAERMLRERLGHNEQQNIAEQYLADLRTNASKIRGRV